jgi:hypothetical protein
VLTRAQLLKLCCWVTCCRMTDSTSDGAWVQSSKEGAAAANNKQQQFSVSEVRLKL